MDEPDAELEPLVADPVTMSVVVMPFELVETTALVAWVDAVVLAVVEAVVLTELLVTAALEVRDEEDAPSTCDARHVSWRADASCRSRKWDVRCPEVQN